MMVDLNIAKKNPAELGIPKPKWCFQIPWSYANASPV
jgi:hypothetical protein